MTLPCLSALFICVVSGFLWRNLAWRECCAYSVDHVTIGFRPVKWFLVFLGYFFTSEGIHVLQSPYAASRKLTLAFSLLERDVLKIYVYKKNWAPLSELPPMEIQLLHLIYVRNKESRLIVWSAQGYTFNKYSYQNKRERISAQKLLPNQMGFHYSKINLKKKRFLPSCFLWRVSVFVWFKINTTLEMVSSFLSAIARNFTSHKVLFQTHLLPRLIQPPQILKVECCRRKHRAQSHSATTVGTNPEWQFLHQQHRDNGKSFIWKGCSQWDKAKEVFVN